MADVFVSYSRRDSEFVGRLAEAMAAGGKEVWLDTEGIADGEVFPEAIKRAIEGSDAFLFVITPASVASSYCENEVEYAREMQKRIVPVLRERVADVQLPGEIRDRNWIPFENDSGFATGIARLLAALEHDLEAAKAHTRWLVKAIEWDGESRDKSFLLRGAELNAAEAWLAASPEGADPAPTQLQRAYLLASRTAAARRQRVLVGASLTTALISIGLVIFALISRSDAVRARTQAVSEQIAARSQALAAESQAQLPNDPEISLILGMRAVREKATPQSLFALRAALDASPLQRGLPTVERPGSCGINAGLSAAVSPDGRQIAEGACNGSLLLLDAARGRVVHAEHVANQVTTVAYSPSGSLLAVGTNRQVLLIDTPSGRVLARTNTTAPAPGQPGVSALAFSPDGRELATNFPNRVMLLSVPTLRARQLARYPAVGGGMVFTHDGKKLVVGGAYDRAFQVYDVASGRLVRRVASPTHGGFGSWAEVVALSRDGSELAVGYPTASFGDGTVSIYSTRTWAKRFDVTTVHNVEIAAVAFSPDGTRLAIGAEDGTAGVWSLIVHEELVSYAGPTAAVTAMAFTAGGRSVLTASNDGIARLWRAVGVEQAIVPVPGNLLWVSIVPGLLAVVEEGNGKLWLSTFRLPGGRPLRAWPLGPALTTGLVLSTDARYLVTFTTPAGPTAPSVSAPVRIWSVATHRVVRTLPRAHVTLAAMSNDDSRLYLVIGTSPTTAGLRPEVVDISSGHVVKLQLHEPCGYVPPWAAFSGDDSVIAAGSFCGYVDVWNAKTGRLLRQVNEGGEVSQIDMSPDGSRLLVGSWDSRATIWSVKSGHPLVQLIGHTRGIDSAVFGAGGSLVVTSALDHTVRVWDARTGQQLRVLSFTDSQGTISPTPDGHQVAIGEVTPVLGVAGVVRVFDICPACTDAKALLGLAAPHVTDRLTTLERTVINGAEASGVASARGG